MTVLPTDSKDHAVASDVLIAEVLREGNVHSVF